MKTMKRLAALLLAAVLCLSLAGCRELDEARANHAFWNEDGSIQWGNTTYKMLPACEDFYPEIDSTLPTVYVTDPGVPVLLREMYGQGFDQSKDGVFLRYGYEDDRYYCRSDKYADTVARIEAGFKPEGYCYIYWGYDEKTEEYGEFTYRLTDQQTLAVDRVQTTVEPTDLPEGASMAYEYTVYLEACSDDLLFRRGAFEVSVVGGTYYLVEYTDDDTLLRKVPDADAATFAGIMAAYIEAEMKFNVDYEAGYSI